MMYQMWQLRQSKHLKGEQGMLLKPLVKELKFLAQY